MLGELLDHMEGAQEVAVKPAIVSCGGRASQVIEGSRLRELLCYP